MLTEADTCRTQVLPKLYAAGWNDDRIREQHAFTSGRIVVAGSKATRRPGKRAVAFQVCWKLWSSRGNACQDPTRKPRILYLAERTFQTETAAELDALLPALLDRAFKGCL